MSVIRKIIEIDEELCNGCGQCVPECAEGAIQVIDGKARLVKDRYCDGLGACLGECPTGALTIVEREADEFDEEAVEEHLGVRMQDAKKAEPTLACGCPSTQVQSFKVTPSHHEDHRPDTHDSFASNLSHWPVQIRLVPPTAPFLKGAHLLVAADCTPVAYPHFHRDFLRGKAVMVGCPKFDNAQEYVQKFADIFKTADIQGDHRSSDGGPLLSGAARDYKESNGVSGEGNPFGSGDHQHKGKNPGAGTIGGVI